MAAAGNRPLFPPDRDIEDHVCCIFEFPAPATMPKTRCRRRRRSASSTPRSTATAIGGYGETVLGTEGTLVLEREQDVMLFKVANTEARPRCWPARREKASRRQALLEIDENGDEQSAAIGRLAMLPAGRGYAEELEHWAWCIRNPPGKPPPCHPRWPWATR